MKRSSSWKYIGDAEGDRWKWKAFLDDFGSGDLADVESVEYVLHPTFPKPVQEINDPEDGFALEADGGGNSNSKPSSI